MFGDDFFGAGGIEDLFNKLSGGSYSVGSNKHSPDSKLLNIVKRKGKEYFIFDLSGKDFETVSIDDDLETNEYGEKVHSGQKILKIIFDGNKILKFALPRELRKRSLKHNFNNGILEVVLEK